MCLFHLVSGYSWQLSQFDRKKWDPWLQQLAPCTTSCVSGTRGKRKHLWTGKIHVHTKWCLEHGEMASASLPCKQFEGIMVMRHLKGCAIISAVTTTPEEQSIGKNAWFNSTPLHLQVIYISMLWEWFATFTIFVAFWNTKWLEDTKELD